MLSDVACGKEEADLPFLRAPQLCAELEEVKLGSQHAHQQDIILDFLAEKMSMERGSQKLCNML